MELSPAVTVPVTVNTVWSAGPYYWFMTTAQPVMGTNTIYTSTAIVNSFGKHQSGNYTCTAIIAPVSLFLTGSTTQLATQRVTVGKYNAL